MSYTTNNKNLVFIGKKDGEEYYLDFKDNDIRGWSFMGLRPETEEKLRQYSRDTNPEEMLGIDRKDFEAISTYLMMGKAKKTF